MSISDAMRKQNLQAEIIILIQNLNQASGGITNLVVPSNEEFEKLSLSELESLKREFRDLARTLGGVNGR